jgi:PhnB protein
MSEIPNLPPGMHQLSPHLVCDGAADAIDFYVRAFGGEELMRLPGEDGRIMHACVVVNGSSVLLVDENREYGLLGPKALGGSPVVIHLVVPDADATFARAVEAGATVRAPVAEMFWGDRYGVLEDPFGHVWSIATPQRAPLTESELADAAAAAPPGA